MKKLGDVSAHTDHGAGVGAVKIVFLENRACIVSAGVDGSIKMFDGQGKCISTQKIGDRVQIGSLCSALGWLFVGYKGPAGPGTAGFVRAYNFNEASVPMQNFCLRQDFPAAHEGQVNDIAVVAEKGWVITCSDDRTIRVWQPGAEFWTMAGDLVKGCLDKQSLPTRRLSRPSSPTTDGYFLATSKAISKYGMSPEMAQRFRHCTRTRGKCPSSSVGLTRRRLKIKSSCRVATTEG